MIGVKIVGALLILAGVGWGLLCFAAGGMADREVDFRSEVLLPASIGLIPVGFGILFLL